MAVETLPFVQVNLPKNDNGAGLEPGSRTGADSPDASRFEGLMAGYARQNAEPAPQPAEQPQPAQAVYQGKTVVLPEGVLDLMEGEELPGTVEKIVDVLMGKAQGLLDKLTDALGGEGVEKLSAILSQVKTGFKTGKLSGLASVLEKTAKSLESLANDIEANPDAVEVETPAEDMHAIEDANAANVLNALEDLDIHFIGDSGA